MLCNHCWVLLILWADAESCWNVLGSLLNNVWFNGFATHSKKMLPIHGCWGSKSFFTKMNVCYSSIIHSPPHHYGWRMMTSSYHWNQLFCFFGWSNINFIILLIARFFHSKDLLIGRKDSLMFASICVYNKKLSIVCS